MVKLIHVTPHKDFTLTLEYNDGFVCRISFKPLISRGGIFAELNKLELFMQAHPNETGDAVEFSEDFDFDAANMRLDNELYPVLELGDAATSSRA